MPSPSPSTEVAPPSCPEAQGLLGAWGRQASFLFLPNLLLSFLLRKPFYTDVAMKPKASDTSGEDCLPQAARAVPVRWGWERRCYRVGQGPDQSDRPTPPRQQGSPPDHMGLGGSENGGGKGEDMTQTAGSRKKTPRLVPV